MSRLLDAMKWLAAEISADRHDFRAKFQQGADDLRDGLVAQGWARHSKKLDRYAISEAGERVLAAMATADL